jgi:chemotaxis protein CheD
MYVRTSKKYNKNINIIQPGEYYVSGKDEIISTVLGSCVAVCFHDPINRVSGMNHFMLPGRVSESDFLNARSAKYGITAISDLLHQTCKLGAGKGNLNAKIFGGGHITGANMDHSSIPEDNIRLAKLMIEMEDIPIVEIDVGGNYTRKLLMDVKTGVVFLKKTSKNDIIQKIYSRDMEFIKSWNENYEQNKGADSR